MGSDASIEGWDYVRQMHEEGYGYAIGAGSQDMDLNPISI